MRKDQDANALVNVRIIDKAAEHLTRASQFICIFTFHNHIIHNEYDAFAKVCKVFFSCFFHTYIRFRASFKSKFIRHTKCITIFI